MATSAYPLVAALAWSSLISAFVIYFFKEADRLFERIVDSGAKALAVSYIESAELLPSIVGLIERAEEIKTEKEKEGIDATFENVLQEIEFRDEIECAQNAFGKIDQLDRDYEELVDIASRTWRTGAIHIFSTVGATIAFLYLNNFMRDGTLVVLVLLAMITFASSTQLVVSYDKKRRSLMGALKENRNE